MGVKSDIHLIDNLEFMKGCKDNEFDWGVADPPYGVKGNKVLAKTGKGKTWQSCGDELEWDKEPPPPEFWSEYFRITKNQIVFGANYFINYLHQTNGMWSWRKLNGKSFFADFELIWISNCTVNRDLPYAPSTMKKDEGDRIHPTQKPRKIYRDLFKKFIPKGSKVIDPFLGSGNSRIVAYMRECDFVGLEKEKLYLDRHIKRFESFSDDWDNKEKQAPLFVPDEYKKCDLLGIVHE